MIFTTVLLLFTGTLLHSAVSFPKDTHKHSDLQQEINGIKEEIKDLFEKVRCLNKNEDCDSNDADDNNNHICLSKECIATSNGLFERMNLNAKPCEDFNQFACGNFITEMAIPDDKGRLTSFTPARDIGEVL